jgi:xylulokinase
MSPDDRPVRSSGPVRDTAACLIGLDLGTTGLKGVLMDRQGRVRAGAEADTCLLHPAEGRVEVDPGGHRDAVYGVIRTLADAAGGRVSALAMAGATGNTLLTDAAGTPLTPIINWMDRRAERNPPRALDGLTAREVARIVGWPCVTTFPLAHLAWLREHEAAAWGMAAHIGMAADWLIHDLTGRWIMDHSTATTFHLQDQVSGTWYDPFLQRLGIAPGQLSALCDSAAPIGPLTAEAARELGLTTQTVVFSGCFDHPAAARAAGVMRSGQLLLSCGTSWVGFLPHPDRGALLEAGLLCDPFLSARGGPWGGIFSVPAIGRTIDRYVTEVIAPGVASRWAVFDRLAARSAPGAGGLTLDLREPVRRIDAPPEHVSRAVMEGAARLLAEKLDNLRAHGLQYRDAVMVGGPSQSAVWADMLAGFTGLSLSRGGRAAGARGAAMLAGIGAGWYRDESEALLQWSHDA